mgnify:CR=1 FL=1
MFTTPLTPAADLGDFAYNFRHGRKEIKWRRGSGKSYASCSRFLEIISISRDAVMPIKSPNSPARQSIFNPPRDTGIKIEVIGGEEEARLIYDNHIEEMLDRRYDYLYVDVGGGTGSAFPRF